MLIMVVELVLMALLSLGAMAMFTLLERNFLGMVQLRKGPQKVGPFGLLQPVADAIKLLSKSSILPTKANQVPFLLAPVMALVMALGGWALLPSFGVPSVWFKYGGFVFMCLSSMSVYPVMISGWSSNSKYSLLGAVRSVAQTISYEVSMGFVFISLVSCYCSLSLYYWSVSKIFVGFMLPSMTMMWLAIILAESNRSPFDLAEGESELVSGFNTEYSSWGFTMIFMAEYLSILMLSFVTSLIVFPHITWLAGPVLITLVSLVFLVARGSLPRQRYDHLMFMTWTTYLPVSMGFVVGVVGLK